MTAVEEIQTAIDELTRLKDSSTEGYWRVYEDSGTTIHSDPETYSPLIDAGDFAASSERFENPADAYLIVTLHRTIDAQLAILRLGLAFYHGDPTLLPGVVRAADNALALARAINGVTS